MYTISTVGIPPARTEETKMSSIRHVIRWVDRSDAVYFGAETLDEMAERYDFDATAAASGEVALRDAHGAIVGWVMPAQPKHPHPGRPLLGREKRRRYVVTLEPATAETARQIGAGNLSAGLTAAVERFGAVLRRLREG